MNRKYIDLKGQVVDTGFGIKIVVFINDKELDRCKVFRKNYNDSPNPDKTEIENC